MVDTVTGIGQSQAEIADAINRKYAGYSQKQKNQMMQAGTSDPGSFAMQYQPEIQQAQQPSEFWGAGRKETSGTMDPTIQSALGYGLSNLGGQNYYYGDVDPTSLKWGIGGYGTKDLGGGKYDILNSSGSSIGTGYKTAAEAVRELGGTNYSTGTGGALSDWEALGQMLNGGSVANRQQWGGLPTNSINEQISGLNTLFGSTPLISNDKVLGYKFNLGPGTGGNYVNGDDTLQTNPFGYQFTHEGKSHSYSSGLGRQLNTPDQWRSLGKLIDNNYSFYTPTSNASKLPGWTQTENYARQKHPQGFLSEVFGFLDPVLDTLDPMHNTVQKWTTGSSETDKQSPYFEQIMPMILDAFLPGVGSAVSAVDSGSKGNWGNAALSALNSYGGITGGGGMVSTGYGSVADAAANSALKSGISSLASGQPLEQSLLNSLLGAASGAAGGYVGNSTKSLGGGLSGFLSGATSGAVNNLNNSNTMLQSALVSGIGGGLGGLFNGGVNPKDTKTLASNRQMGNNIAKLGSIFVKGKK